MDPTESIPPVGPPGSVPGWPMGPPPLPPPAPTKKWYTRPRWWVLIAAVVLIAGATGVLVALHGSGNPSTKAATGGAGASTASTGQPAVGNGYLANEPGAVVFIQWTESGTDLTGSAQVETLSGSPPNQTVHTDTLTVSGQLQGSTITLSFNGGTEVFGTLSGGSFTVNFPQTDGSLAPVTFSSATAAQFNQALAELQGNTGSADSQAAAADQLAAERAAIDRASSEVSSQLSGLQSDVSSMNSSLGAFSAQLGQEQADLATEAALEQQVITESQNGTDNNQVCSDADTVASDGDTVDSDGDSVSSDADTTESDVTGVRNDIGNLQGAATALQNAQAALPSYDDGAPTQSTVNQTIASAQQAISSAIGTANTAIAQANGYENQGYQDAQGAASAGNCAAPAQPYTQPTIA